MVFWQNARYYAQDITTQFTKGSQAVLNKLLVTYFPSQAMIPVCGSRRILRNFGSKLDLVANFIFNLKIYSNSCCSSAMRKHN